MKKNEFIQIVKFELENKNQRSAWNKGVNIYCFELLETLEERDFSEYQEKISGKLFEKMVLNGAGSWSEYSWGGCSFIYNEDIAKTLCSPSELKKTCNGSKKPNKSEEWLDVQARALYQACVRLYRVCLKVWEGEYNIDTVYMSVQHATAAKVHKIAK